MAIKDQHLKYSKGQIDSAGKILLDSDIPNYQKQDALDILNNFRAAHNYPINTFQSTLRFKLEKLGINYLVSQRLKRTPSILFKLERLSGMRLTQMQDIGGLRVTCPQLMCQC